MRKKINRSLVPPPLIVYFTLTASWHQSWRISKFPLTMAWNKEADINIKVQEHNHLSFDQLIGFDVIFR